MSTQPNLARPRRASRAPSRLGDENGVAASTSTLAPNAVPRLMSKTSLNGIGGPAATRIMGKPVGMTTSTNGVSLAVTGVRRALGDVSNAGKTASTLMSGLTKDGLTTKPSRPKTTTSVSTISQQQQAANAAAGFARLKIGSSSSSSSSHAVAPTKASRAVLTSNVSRKEELLQVPRVRDVEGLGGKNEYGSDYGVREAYGDDMGGDSDAIMSSIPTSDIPTISVPSSHDVEVFSEEEDDEAEEEAKTLVGGRRVESNGIIEDDPSDWVKMMSVDHEALRVSSKMIEDVRDVYEEPLDYWDTTMVAEYSDEIFAYMAELEVKAMPNPRYMDHQTEIEWSMRTTLIDWLLQVHARYHMLPETLWIAINLIDRFLSNRVVSLVKFQLVGVTAMFIAAKYEEIMAPSVEEFVYMTESGYTKDEIIKGERIILQSLEFNISPYCSPYSWVRRISKADDYDIQTRTLSKFLMEVTLLDHRFLRAKPSMIAAIGMYLARRMLGGEWNEDFIYYSNYTEAQLIVPTGFLLESIVDDEFEKKFVYKKYGNKKFLKASVFARNWARANHTA